MTNDEFDDHYYERFLASEDAAVSEIATFGWGLYSSDVLLPYRLSGRHAVPVEVRARVERACVFLGSDRDYGWPTGVRGVEPFWMPGCAFLIGSALLVGAFAAEGFERILSLVLGGLAILLWMNLSLTRGERRAKFDRFLLAGDPSAWPFLRRSEWEEALGEWKGRKTPHLADEEWPPIP
jgi:hypothetical protein